MNKATQDCERSLFFSLFQVRQAKRNGEQEKWPRWGEGGGGVIAFHLLWRKITAWAVFPFILFPGLQSPELQAKPHGI